MFPAIINLLKSLNVRGNDLRNVLFFLWFVFDEHDKYYNTKKDKKTLNK